MEEKISMIIITKACALKNVVNTDQKLFISNDIVQASKNPDNIYSYYSQVLPE